MSTAPDTLVTYGDLIRDASRSAWAATEALAATRITDDEAARAEMAAWRNVIAATHRHGRVLLGNDQRAAAIRTCSDADPTTSPPRRSSMRWLPWLRVTALIATHRPSDGTAASPAAWELDDRDVRSAGYAHLADLTIAALGASDTLAVRAGQGGAGRREVARK